MRTRRALLLALVAAALIPAGADAAPAPEDSALSPQLAELADPAVRSLPPAEIANRLDVAPSGPGSLVGDGAAILVEVRSEGPPPLAAIEAIGAEVVAADPALGRLTASVSPADLEALGALAGVASVTPVRAPLVSAVNCEGGSVISEAVTQLRAGAARVDHAVNGAGVTVGILSDSFDQATKRADGSGGAIATKAAKDVSTADLPGPGSGCAGQEAAVRVVRPYEPKSGSTLEVFDEGRAMAQAVHDVAPGAGLAFASAYNGELAFAAAIEKLAAPLASGGGEAKAIVDDVAYFEEPFFQDGPVAGAVERVVSQGVTYLSAAGNNNIFDAAGREIASWETPNFRDIGSCPAAVVAVDAAARHCLDFASGAAVDPTFGISGIRAGRTLTVDLQWAEPWNGVATDEDAYLLGPAGNVVAEAVDNNLASQKPVEILQWTNKTGAAANVQLVIDRFHNGTPRTKFALLQNGAGVGGTEYPQSEGGDVVGPTVFGHAAAAGAIAVGAVPYAGGGAPESYSSRGPATHYFGPVVGAAPAAPLASPQVISKPDLTATDCAATTFFASLSGSTWRFCGTSQAAPHVAGVVALMRQAAATSGIAAGPAALGGALRASARPIGSAGPCAVGAGLVDADAAISSLLAGGAGPGPLCLAPSAPVGPAPAPSATPGLPPRADPVTANVPVAPATRIRHHPAAVVRTPHRTARVTFSFASDQAGAGFRCRIDGGAQRPCPARLARRFALGRHRVRVQATSPAGLADPTPAAFRFRVVRAG